MKRTGSVSSLLLLVGATLLGYGIDYAKDMYCINSGIVPATSINIRDGFELARESVGLATAGE
jgi:hypothetical protein